MYNKLRSLFRKRWFIISVISVTFVFLISLAILVYLVYFGNTQTNKYVYIFRAYCFPGTVREMMRHGCGSEYHKSELRTYGLIPPKDYTGVWYTYHLNGQKESEARYISGMKHGTCLSWHPNGQRAAEATYIDDVIQGKYLTWYGDGNKLYEFHYEEGVCHGPQTQYHKNGQKRKERIYEHGTSKRVTFWDKNGKMLLDGYFVDGEKHHGTFIKDCDHKGNILVSEYYEDGKLSRIDKHPTSEKQPPALDFPIK